MAVNIGVRMFCTTASARNAMEEVPVNPLSDQVNPAGSDPEESDSDLEDEDDDNGIVEDAVVTESDEEESVSAAQEDDVSDYEESVSRRRRSTREARNRSSTTPTANPAPAERRSSDFNVDLASAIRIRARLPARNLGAVELLTFFPAHTQWPEAGLRLYRNGWTTLDIAKMQLHARGRLSKSTTSKRVGALRHQVLTNGKIFFNDSRFKQSSHAHLMTAVTSYDASQYQPRPQHASSLVTASLADIARGVVNWPTGQDRGIVTQVIEHAHRNNLAQYTTDDIPMLAQQMAFRAPSEASATQWDQHAHQRARQIVEQAGTYV